MQNSIIIIGAGLTGLTATYLLKQKNIKALLLEGRERIGGRIETVEGKNHTPMEMGATWFEPRHAYLLDLLKKLEASYFPQFQKGKALFQASPSAPPQVFEIPQGGLTYRVQGGTKQIINKLSAYLDESQILLGERVEKIVKTEENLEVLTTQNNQYQATQVISTLPPKLLVETIDFEPQLPEDFIKLFHHTHTWMGDSIKFAVEYARPFWRKNGFSGNIFSQGGIAQEVHDHSNFEENAFALKGFLSPNSRQISASQREAAVITQFTKLFGKVAVDYLSYHEKIWADESFTTHQSNNHLVPHQNNGNPAFQQTLLEGSLIIAGTETSPHFGGYMEGAVRSAHKIVGQVLEKLEQSV